jgi:hypothetical protein
MKIKLFGQEPLDLTTSLLWLTIISATLLRLSYPCFANPLDYLVFDTLRHYQHGLHMGKDALSMLEPVGYQFWLTGLFKLINPADRWLIAGYAGTLCAITPYIWYRWMLHCLPSKRAALVGYAMLSILPSWIAIFSLFMAETLLLPLLGLALWMSWSAKKKGTAISYMIAALAWAAAIATKMTVLPPLVVTTIWLANGLFEKRTKLSAALVSLSFGLIVLAGYLSSPLYVYRNLGDFWLFPPGWARVNQLFCESGAESFTFVLIHDGRPEWIGYSFNPSLNDLRDANLSILGWKDPRQGRVQITIDAKEKWQFYHPGMTMSLSEACDLIIENVVLFFFAQSWPDAQPHDRIHQLEIVTRWIWFPLTILAIFLMIKLKRTTVVEVIFIVTTLANLFQHYTIMEGRYRKPWEGLLIVALISLLSRWCQARQRKA